MKPANKTFIIAEAGVNHNGNMQLAKKLVDVAIEVGADAVKFQTFQTEELVAIDAPKADYQRAFSPEETQFDMLKSLELSHSQQMDLQNYCKDKNILFLSSPFDIASVDFLNQKLDLPLFKIASGEITHFPLLLKIAHTNKPVILSTGMSTLSDIEVALKVLVCGYLNKPDLLGKADELFYSDKGQQIIQNKVSLLHCTSEYPAAYDEVNLRAMKTLAQAFALPIGYSDHTEGTAVALAAVACGATIIEKHFTLDRSLPGPDHQVSLTPDELKNMIVSIRQIELALGETKKFPTKSEWKNRQIARKSLVALQPIKKGEKFTVNNLGCKRPGDGISSAHYYDYQNKYAEQDYNKDELIGME